MSTTTKAETLAALHAEFDRWEALLAKLNPAQIAAPQLDEGWSVKDVVAHLWSWQQRSVARLEAALADRAPAYPAWPAQLDPEEEDEPHNLNDWLYQRSREQPWAQVHDAWRTGFLRLLESAAALPEAALLAQDRYPWLDGYALIEVLQGTLEHHIEHADYLVPVLGQLQPDQQ